jgi:hypothetical protein
MWKASGERTEVTKLMLHAAWGVLENFKGSLFPAQFWQIRFPSRHSACASIEGRLVPH